MVKYNNLNQLLKYTQCVNIWLFNMGKFETLMEYESYVKSMIKDGLKDFKTLSEWLSETNYELFAEYNNCIEYLV